MTAQEQQPQPSTTHPLRRKGFALATLAAATVGVSAFALAAATGDLSGGAKIGGSDGVGGGFFGMGRRGGVSGSPASSSGSSGHAVRERAWSIASLGAEAQSTRGLHRAEEKGMGASERATSQRHAKPRSMAF